MFFWSNSRKAHHAIQHNDLLLLQKMLRKGWMFPLHDQRWIQEIQKNEEVCVIFANHFKSCMHALQKPDKINPELAWLDDYWLVS